METTLAKIAISVVADEALSSALGRVNQEFDGGRVNKTDVASWLILQGAQNLTQHEVDEIRRKHFNQVKYLESLLKRLKGSGRDTLTPAELDAVQNTFTQDFPKKKARFQANSRAVDPQNHVQAA
jgi:hypothetical protein